MLMINLTAITYLIQKLPKIMVQLFDFFLRTKIRNTFRIADTDSKTGKVFFIMCLFFHNQIKPVTSKTPTGTKTILVNIM